MSAQLTEAFEYQQAPPQQETNGSIKGKEERAQTIADMRESFLPSSTIPRPQGAKVKAYERTTFSADSSPPTKLREPIIPHVSPSLLYGKNQALLARQQLQQQQHAARVEQLEMLERQLSDMAMSHRSSTERGKDMLTAAYGGDNGHETSAKQKRSTIGHMSRSHSHGNLERLGPQTPARQKGHSMSMLISGVHDEAMEPTFTSATDRERDIQIEGLGTFEMVDPKRSRDTLTLPRTIIAGEHVKWKTLGAEHGVGYGSEGSSSNNISAADLDALGPSSSQRLPIGGYEAWQEAEVPVLAASNIPERYQSLVNRMPRRTLQPSKSTSSITDLDHTSSSSHQSRSQEQGSLNVKIEHPTTAQEPTITALTAALERANAIMGQCEHRLDRRHQSLRATFTTAASQLDALVDKQEQNIPDVRIPDHLEPSPWQAIERDDFRHYPPATVGDSPGGKTRPRQASLGVSTHKAPAIYLKESNAERDNVVHRKTYRSESSEYEVPRKEQSSSNSNRKSIDKGDSTRSLSRGSISPSQKADNANNRQPTSRSRQSLRASIGKDSKRKSSPHTSSRLSISEYQGYQKSSNSHRRSITSSPPPFRPSSSADGTNSDDNLHHIEEVPPIPPVPPVPRVHSLASQSSRSDLSARVRDLLVNNATYVEPMGKTPVSRGAEESSPRPRNSDSDEGTSLKIPEPNVLPRLEHKAVLATRRRGKTLPGNLATPPPVPSLPLPPIKVEPLNAAVSQQMERLGSNSSVYSNKARYEGIDATKTSKPSSMATETKLTDANASPISDKHMFEMIEHLRDVERTRKDRSLSYVQLPVQSNGTSIFQDHFPEMKPSTSKQIGNWLKAPNRTSKVPHAVEPSKIPSPSISTGASRRIPSSSAYLNLGNVEADAPPVKERGILWQSSMPKPVAHEDFSSVKFSAEKLQKEDDSDNTLTSRSSRNGTVGSEPVDDESSESDVFHQYSDWSIPSQTADARIKCMSPRAAVGRYLPYLSPYEQTEIFEYNEIYYVGRNSEKVQADVELPTNNFGFDDERGDYQIVIGDHLSYRYEVIEVLGKGSFGQVVKAMDHKTGELAAVKIIRNKKRFHHQALVEIKILENLIRWDPEDRHNNIRMNEHFSFRNHLCIACECLSINLYEFIKAHNFQGFSCALIRRFTIQLLNSLTLLNRRRVVHCDLKPENILLKHPSRSAIKVIDFGSSCLESEKVYTYIQSRFYRSPEVILGMTYNMAIDMWSLGCILAELRTGYPLFPGENEQEQLACIMEIIGVPERYLIEKSTRKKLFFDSNNQPRIIPNSKGRKRYPGTKKLADALKCDDRLFIDFIARCLEWDPERRMTPEQGLQHEWIREEFDAQDGRRSHRRSKTSSHRSSRQATEEAWSSSTSKPSVPKLRYPAPASVKSGSIIVPSTLTDPKVVQSTAYATHYHQHFK